MICNANSTSVDVNSSLASICRHFSLKWERSRKKTRLGSTAIAFQQIWARIHAKNDVFHRRKAWRPSTNVLVKVFLRGGFEPEIKKWEPGRITTRPDKRCILLFSIGISGWGKTKNGRFRPFLLILHRKYGGARWSAPQTLPVCKFSARSECVTFDTSLVRD